MQSPRLTRDEWILLLDLYLGRRPRSVAANDPELLEISAVLSRRSGISDGTEDHWRSPDGLRARLSVFRVLDPTVDTPETKRATLGQAVWNTYAADPAGCAEAALAIRKMFSDTRPARSPRLDADEWTLLLDLFVSVGHRTLPGSHPGLGRLSDLMRQRRTGPTFDPAWRSADGLRREMTVLRTLKVGLPLGQGKRAEAAEVIWRRYIDDPAALATAVQRIEADIAGRPSQAALARVQTTNPDWTLDETLLALDAYLQVRPRFAAATDPAILGLSRLLQLNAERHGVDGAAPLRNAAGVARKVNKFRAAEAGDGPTRVKGAKLEAEVWGTFEAHPGETLLRASALRDHLLIDLDINGPYRSPDDVVVPSRGPSPAFGPVTHDRKDGDCLVYLMVLTGPVSALYPAETAEDLAIVKVGRTNNLLRRAAQHNKGFPPGCSLAWRPIDCLAFSSAGAAHGAERDLLDHLHTRGLTLGGEFAKVPAQELGSLLALIASDSHNIRASGSGHAA